MKYSVECGRKKPRSLQLRGSSHRSKNTTKEGGAVAIAKKENTVKLEVVGNNAESVTGSCTKIEYGGHVALFECGGIQDGHTILENYRLNRQMVQKIKAKEIEIIILGHCHYDHISNICTLFARGCRARIIAPKGSTAILREMWLDSAFINERDCEVLSLKSDKEYYPLYTESDVKMALDYVEEYDSNEIYQLDEYLSIRFSPAGHILCSQQTEVFISINNHTSKILFTSDLGNVLTQESRVFVENLKPIPKANIVIGEATYAARGRSMTKKDYKKDLEKIRAVIEQYCVDSNHRVLIPTFSLDRMPYILWILWTLFGEDENFKIPILVDSPLANRLLDCYSSILEGEAKEVFDKVVAWKNIRRIVTPEDSKAAVVDGGAKIICASSGMLTAGRSVAWTQSILPRHNDCILFMGYAGEDTLAYKIKHNKDQKTININGKPCKNNAQIVDLISFSGHMQRDDLIKYYKSINCEKIYLVHSNQKDKLDFKADLEEELSKMCKSTRVIAVNKGTKINL